MGRCIARREEEDGRVGMRVSRRTALSSDMADVVDDGMGNAAVCVLRYRMMEYAAALVRKGRWRGGDDIDMGAMTDGSRGGRHGLNAEGANSGFNSVSDAT